MALVDNIILIAETPEGLHAMIHHSTTHLLQCEMTINQAHAVLVVGLGKQNRSRSQADLYHR